MTALCQWIFKSVHSTWSIFRQRSQLLKTSNKSSLFFYFNIVKSICFYNQIDLRFSLATKHSKQMSNLKDTNMLSFHAVTEIWGACNLKPRL